jgi:hypothetical protein
MLASATEVGAIADWNTRITQSDEAREQALEEAAKAMDAKAAAIKRLYDAEPPGVVAASYSASWHAFKEAAAIIRALKRGAPRKRPAYEQGCDKEG